jgi:putative PIN family toxin of toxin-antitoxin system
MSHRFVFDTNSLISAALLRNSVNAVALSQALELGRIVISKSTLSEFEEVIYRKKFDKYFIDNGERVEAINKIQLNSLEFKPDIVINACRDPKDNKFLELAIAAEASCIISGDLDLLVLHPFKGILILSASDFLKTSFL